MIYFLDLHENHGCAIRLAITPSWWGSMFAHAPAGLYLYTLTQARAVDQAHTRRLIRLYKGSFRPPSVLSHLSISPC